MSDALNAWKSERAWIKHTLQMLEQEGLEEDICEERESKILSPEEGRYVEFLIQANGPTEGYRLFFQKSGDEWEVLKGEHFFDSAEEHVIRSLDWEEAQDVATAYDLFLV